MRVDKLAVLACTATVVLAQHGYTPSDIEDGGRLFQANCAACHGPDGDMVQGVDFGHGRFRGPSSDQALIKVIRDGIAGTAMPPHSFTEFQTGIIVAYLRSMAETGSGTSGKGDAARGKLLFESKGGCGGCHRVYGAGSRTGPDLSEIGSLRRAVELEHSLLEPNRAILLQNRTYRAVTRDGETITGRLLNQDSFSVQLLDSRERLLSLDRSKLREAGFVNDAPKHSYRDKFTAAESSDVVAYLVSLKGAPTPP